MKRFATLLFLLVGFAAAAHYLGWYTVTKTRNGNQLDVHVTIDEQKIRVDEAKARERLEYYGKQFKERPVTTGVRR